MFIGQDVEAVEMAYFLLRHGGTVVGVVWVVRGVGLVFGFGGSRGERGSWGSMGCRLEGPLLFILPVSLDFPLVCSPSPPVSTLSHPQPVFHALDPAKQ